MVREWISELRNSDRGAEIDQLTRQRRLGSLATGGRAGESGLVHPSLASGGEREFTGDPP